MSDGKGTDKSAGEDKMAEMAAGPDVATTGATTGSDSEKPQEPQDAGLDQALATENGEEINEGILSLVVILPDGQPNIQLTVSSHEQVHEIRQSIIDLPTAYQYTCFHLEYQDTRVNDFVPLSEVPDIASGAELRVVLDPYTEKEARLHVIRIRELIGAAGDRTDTAHGIAHGLSIIDDISEAARGIAGADVVKSYDFSADPSLSTLLPPTTEEPAAPKTIKGIALSPWNPPPCHLRQKGHLVYLLLTTNEGEQFHVTSHVGGFYVNKSSNTKFDPSPRVAPKGCSAHSLLSLIEQLSPSFLATFEALQQHNARKEALSTFQITNTLPASPWAIPPPSSNAYAHVPDPTRSQESYLIAGIDNADTLRDWNEEIQSAKELPKDTIQDRLFRERLISKLFADYVDAATRGAVLVARGEVAPLNPTEAVDAQIFVYNNVFFSFGADGVGTFTSEGGDEAARVATGKDVSGVRLINQLDIDGLYTPGTVVVDYMGKRIVGQSIVPGIFRQRDPGEAQIDYGAVDGKDVIASDERFVPVFERMSRALKVKKHAVWDKDGKRVELEASVETKGLLGTDGRKYALDLYRITPLDIAWLEECAEQASSGGASEYPHRMTVLRPELVELYARHKLRESLKAQAARVEEERPAKTEGEGDQDSTNTNAAEPQGKEETEGDDSQETPRANELEDQGSPSKESAPTPQPASDAVEQQAEVPKAQVQETTGDAPMLPQVVSLNPDVFSGQKPQTEEELEQMNQDEQDVRAVCQYLRGRVIAELVRELKESDISFPMDGTSLSRLLHKRGINMRYIGAIATLCRGDDRLGCLQHLCIHEMISRSFKHVASAYMREVPTSLIPACVAHLLNCLVGADFNSQPEAQVDPALRQLYPKADLGFETATPKSIRDAVAEQAARRFRYTLGPGWWAAIRPLQLLRQVSLKLGLQLQAKQYSFETAPELSPPSEPQPVQTPPQPQPSAGSESKKKKKAKDKAASHASAVATPTVAPCTFMPDDIVNLVPVVKHSCPRSALAEEALEAGRLALVQDQRKIGQELLLESLSLHEQIYGILHPEVARAYSTLSNLYFQLDDKEAAVELARKAVIVSERTLGLDASETLLNYLTLSLSLHQAGDSGGALVYSRHALNLIGVVYGRNHPDSITTINNAAVMLQSLKAFHESRLWFEECLRICEIVYGKQSVNSATLLFQLAQALALDHDSKGAVRRMRESYTIFLGELGAEDRNTKEAENWLEQLTQNAVSIAKHAKDTQAKRIRAGIRFPPKDNPLAAPRPTELPPSSSSIGGARPADSAQIDSRSIDELMRFIEGTDAQAQAPKAGRQGRGNPKRRGKSTR